MPATRTPELGPALPELLAPLPRALRRVLVAVAALLILGALWLAVRPGSRPDRVAVAGPVAFNVAVPDGLRRLAAPRGELALATPPGAAAPQALRVRPLRLAAYRGDVSAALMLRAGAEEAALRRRLAALAVRGEGRTRVNEQPGYQLQFQFRDGAGRTAYGRLVLLVPPEDDDPAPRTGALLELTAGRSIAIPNVFAVGDNGVLKTALRSFRFGTEVP